jgi:hypothetical protein
LLDVVRLHERLERAETFLAYLDSQWKPLAREELAFEWFRVRREVEKDIDYIVGRINLREDRPAET